jgi:uncharacterized protein YndB with AHSA1/START domain
MTTTQVGPNKNLTIELVSETAARLERTFDAPLELVWRLFFAEEHLPEWWGPRKYETVVDEWDFREGGSWTMRNVGADGEEYAFRGEFREIVPHEHVTWTFEFLGAPGNVSVETIAFEALPDGTTRLSASADYGTVEARDAVVNSGMADGAAETYDRFAELLLRQGA